MDRFFRYKLDHILFWALTVFFHAYTRGDLIDKAGMGQFILELVLRNALLAIVIYITLLFIIPRLSIGKILSSASLILALLVLYVLIKNAHDAYLYSYGLENVGRVNSFQNSLYNLSIALFYLTFATALHLSKQWSLQRELIRRIKLEKLNTELEYLKAQINPHFLFNSINTIFFQIDKQNNEARETLGKFSDMLRYQLYECNGTEIAIEKELLYLKNYVELQKLRRNGQDRIEFTVADNLRGFSMPPLLLIPFIENAFKHVSNFTDQKNEIKIGLSRNENTIRLSVVNTTDEHASAEPGGIGLKNVKRRLELLFPHRHMLDVQKAVGKFEVNLTLELV